MSRLSSNAFKVVFHSRRRNRDEVEVDEIDIIADSDKRPRFLSFEVYENSGDTRSSGPIDTPPANRFGVLSSVVDGTQLTGLSGSDVEFDPGLDSGDIGKDDNALVTTSQALRTTAASRRGRMVQSRLCFKKLSRPSVEASATREPTSTSTSSQPLNTSSKESTATQTDSVTVFNDTGHDEAVQVPPPVTVSEASKKRRTRNPIYLFYEAVNSDSNPRFREHTEGDKYFRCYHTGSIQTVTKLMRCSTTGLENHLRKNAPLMYQLYQVLRNRESPPTEEEVAIANKSIVPSPIRLSQLLYQQSSKNIISALTHQQYSASASANANASLGPGTFDQSTFERLLTEWLIKDDLPFSTINTKPFRSMMEFASASRSPLSRIPSFDTVKRIAKQLEETNEVTCKYC